MPDAAPPVLLRLAAKLWPFLVALVAVYALWLLAAWTLQRRILFPRQMVASVPAWALDVPGLERHLLETAEGPVEWWFVPARGAGADRPAPTVFYAHGNAERIDFQANLVAAWRARGCNVVLCEYRGYGQSAGTPSEEALVADLVAVHDLVVARPEVDRDRLVFHGRSVGTGVVCGLAARRPARGLILVSPFTSIASVMAGYGIPRFAVRDPFDNLDALRRLRTPILALHGDRDGVISIRHSRRLAEELPHVRLVELEGFGHNDLPVEGETARGEIEGFLAQVGVLEAAAPR